MREAYPLAWPTGWPRTTHPERSRFDVSHSQAVWHLLDELRLLGASSVVISSNLQLRRDGLPYSGQRQPDDRGVAVYFKWNGEDQCVPCDKWTTTTDNIRAIGKTIEALRGLERWGAKEMVNAAFRGFHALPAGGETIAMPGRSAWYDVLGVDPRANKEQVKAAYRELIKVHHPDVGGNAIEFQRLQRAFQEGTQVAA